MITWTNAIYYILPLIILCNVHYLVRHHVDLLCVVDSIQLAANAIQTSIDGEMHERQVLQYFNCNKSVKSLQTILSTRRHRDSYFWNWSSVQWSPRQPPTCSSWACRCHTCKHALAVCVVALYVAGVAWGLLGPVQVKNGTVKRIRTNAPLKNH